MFFPRLLCVFRLLVCAIHGIRHSRNAQRMNHSNCSANGFSSVFGKATKKPTPKCSSGKCNGCNVKWLKEFEATWRMNAHVCTRIHVNLFAADFNWCRRHDCDNMRETYAIQKWTFCSPFTIIDNKNLQNDNYNYALCELHRKMPFDCFVPALLKFTVARTNALYFPRHRFVSHSFCSVRWFVKMRYLHRIRREWTQLIKRIHQIATAKRRKKQKQFAIIFQTVDIWLNICLFICLLFWSQNGSVSGCRFSIEIDFWIYKFILRFFSIALRCHLCSIAHMQMHSFNLVHWQETNKRKHENEHLIDRNLCVFARNKLKIHLIETKSILNWLKFNLLYAL